MLKTKPDQRLLRMTAMLVGRKLMSIGNLIHERDKKFNATRNPKFFSLSLFSPPIHYEDSDAWGTCEPAPFAKGQCYFPFIEIKFKFLFFPPAVRFVKWRTRRCFMTLTWFSSESYWFLDLIGSLITIHSSRVMK